MSLARTLCVADLMRSTPFTLPPTLPASDVACRIDAAGVRHVLVVDEAGRLLGLVNRARLLRHLVARRLDGERVRPDRDERGHEQLGHRTVGRVLAVEAVRAMRRHRIGSLPVVDDAGRLMGLLSERMLLPFCETLICGPVVSSASVPTASVPTASVPTASVPAGVASQA